jgi:hypothetical protein
VLPYMPTLQPYRGKPAVRNDRGDRGNVGIIRSPVRASILPDYGEIETGDAFVRDCFARIEDAQAFHSRFAAAAHKAHFHAAS